MFWIFLLVTALATILIKLGAASVTIKLLSLGVSIAVIVIAALAALLLWKKFSKPTTPTSE